MLQPGDANEDCFFDEADFISALQHGRFDIDEPTTWQQGDWNGDERFTTSDLVSAFAAGDYRSGAYSDEAGPEARPSDQLHAFSSADVAPVVVYYESTTGHVVAVSQSPMTAVHLRSSSSRFLPGRAEPPFGVRDIGDLFELEFEGHRVVTFGSALPSGLDRPWLSNDLRLSGALMEGGNLEGAALMVVPQLPIGLVPLRSNPDRPTPGTTDANDDGYVDQYDLIQALQAGTYGEDLEAGPATGDWDGSGRFTAEDFSWLANDRYRLEAYREDAGERQPVGQLVAEPGSTSDVTIHYDSATGDISVVSHVGSLSSLNLYSSDGAFVSGSAPPLASQEPFGLFDEHELFVMDLDGRSAWRFQSSLPIGLTVDTALSGLRLHGSRVAGGGLGTVGIGTDAQLPSGFIPAANPVPRPTSEVQFNATLLYDASNGDVTIVTLESPMLAVELKSQSDAFIGAAQYESEGPFDVNRSDVVFRVAPEGVDQFSFPALLNPGQTLESIMSDMLINGSNIGGNPLDLEFQFYDSEPPRLSGNVFVDINRNGIRDFGEPGYRSVTVVVESVDGTFREQVSSGATSTGDYRFQSLTQGAYRIQATAPHGYVASQPIEFTIGGNTISNNIDLPITTATSFVPFAPGDANGDFVFDEHDLLSIMRSGGFRAADALWSDGDFDLDGDFDRDDLAFAEQAGSYSRDGRPYVELANSNADPPPLRFSPRPEANDDGLQLFYLAEAGTFGIISDNELSALQIHSASGLLKPGDTTGPFDTRSASDSFWFEPTGIQATEGITFLARAGLTLEQLLGDLTIDAVRTDGVTVNRASLSVIDSFNFSLSCVEILASGGIPGDSNLDGIFDSNDLIYTFQHGEYVDGIPGNSTWHTGDWNCDGEFDSADIVAAFQAGGFEFGQDAASAVAVMRQLANRD